MIDVLLSPCALQAATELLPRAQVVILDVLRATSTITTALHNGAACVKLYANLDAARAARASDPAGILAGESACLKPADFDLGNSPREFTSSMVKGKPILLATTNGTLAASRAAGAKRIFVASLLNASATSSALLPDLDKLDTLFICAGTNGKLAVEDVLGAGAVLFAILQSSDRRDLPFTDNAWLAYHAFVATRDGLAAALRLGQGGINVINAGLEADIDHCGQLDAMPLAIALDEKLMAIAH